MDTIKKTPVLENVDYVIIGGSLKNVAAGIRLAESGRRVLIITKETYLSDDLCRGNCNLLPFDRQKEASVFNELLPEEVFRPGMTGSGKWLLQPDKCKLNAEKICEKYGIDLLYNVLPLDVILEGGQKYLRIGGKAGICCIACKEVIAEEPAAGCDTGPDSCYVHLLNLPGRIREEAVTVSSAAEEYTVTVYPGPFSRDHAILEVSCEESRFPSKAEYRLACKQRCLEAFLYLKRNRPEFSESRIGRFSEQGYRREFDYIQEIKQGTALAGYVLDSKPDGISLYFAQTGLLKNCGKNHEPAGEEEVITAFNPGLEKRNYKTLAAAPMLPDEKLTCDVVVVGGGTAGALAALHAARNGQRTLLLEMNQELGGTGTVGGVSTYWFGKRFRDVEEIDQEIQELYDQFEIDRKPGIWSSCDDWNPGIKSMVLTRLCLKAGVRLQYGALGFGVIRDHQTGRVSGVIAVTKEGILSCRAKYTVDATGDGDVAVFAGAEAVYGSERDFITYWASLAQYISPDQYKNNFSSTVLVSDPVDYTRFIRLGRQRGTDTYDHGSYVSPRESRHIRGGYVIDLKDIINYRTYEDGIYTCFSNYDPKGKLSADMIYAGVLPPQVSIQIPLRALLPADKEGQAIPGILVAGKAISCTHNAFPSIRMQPDLMHQGTVIGRIIAEAIKTGTEPEQLDPRRLKNIISGYTGDPLTLTELKMSLEEVVQAASFTDRSHWVDIPFTDEVNTEENALRIMSADSEEIRPILEQRFIGLSKKTTQAITQTTAQTIVQTIAQTMAQTTVQTMVQTIVQTTEQTIVQKTEQTTEQKQLLENRNNLELLSGYLLWHKSELGIQTLLGVILRELRETQGLPVRQASTMCAQLLPDHGVMPEIVYKLNLLAWSSPAVDIMEPFRIVFERLQESSRDYTDIRQGIYHYIEAFPYVAERTGRKEFIPFLLKLSKFKEFGEALRSENNENLLTERLLILLLSINRALARCGERKGYEGLIGLLGLDSLPIAASACMELEALTGQHFGLQETKWREFLEAMKTLLPSAIKDKIW